MKYADALWGRALHKAVKEYICTYGSNPVDVFASEWIACHGLALDYRRGDTWHSLYETGKKHMRDFPERFRQESIVPYLVESNLISVFNGYYSKRLRPDMVAMKDGKYLILDIKCGRTWTQEMVDAEEQLDEYANDLIPYFNLDSIAVCVCNLTRGGQINFIYGNREVKEKIEEDALEMEVIW